MNRMQGNHRKLICLAWAVMMLAAVMSGCVSDMPDTQLETAVTIADIQGAGHVSPFLNQLVEDVHGIVTAVRHNGYFLQSVHQDDDPATSEGVFVFTGLIPGVKPGDEILVSAIVEEWVPGGIETGNLATTQLMYPHVEVLSNGNRLPAPIVIGLGGRMPPTEIIDDDSTGFVSTTSLFDPENDSLDFYESLEGMLVQVNHAVVVGATNQYNEIAVLPDMGTWASVRTPRGGIVIRENDFNPERIILVDGLRQLPLVQVGDYVTEPLIGVMDYSFGNFKLHLMEPVQFQSGGLTPDMPLAPVDPGQLRVASYNVENLSATQPDRIANLADQVVNLMASPDIIGLQEVLDNDGSAGLMAISADHTYQGIIDAIQRLGGPQYSFVNIDPLPDQDGGVPGGNGRVGFLYRTDTGLSLADAPQGDAERGVVILENGEKPWLSLNPGRIDPSNSAFFQSRKPLVVTFIYQDKPLFVINNHFNSKSSDGSLFGEIQPLVFASETQRLAQAQVVHDFVSDLLAVNPNSQVIVLGDLNDFQFSLPLQALQGNILFNLIDTLPVEERYTYVFDGNSQALDHILVSDSLAGKVISMDIQHINAEFDIQRRFSDHDVVIATFDWN